MKPSAIIAKHFLYADSFTRLFSFHWYLYLYRHSGLILGAIQPKGFFAVVSTFIWRRWLGNLCGLSEII